VAVPALAVAGLLGVTLINTVSEVESDVDSALSAARGAADIRVMIEKEYGLVARLPAELDQSKVDAYVAQIADIDRKVEAAIAVLATRGRMVTADAVKGIRDSRAESAKVTADIVKATKSFSQTTALDLVNGPFEVSTGKAVRLLDGIRANVDAVVDAARANLKSSSAWAWKLSPAGLVPVLLATGVAYWEVPRSVVRRPRGILAGMRRLAEGDLDVVLPGLGRQDEIGAMAAAVEAFKIKAVEQARRDAAQKEAEAGAAAAARRGEMHRLADALEAP